MPETSTGTNDANNTDSATSNAAFSHPLVRHVAADNDSDIMLATTLATGMYGVRGERIKHIVHAGALLLPPDALNLMDCGEPTVSGNNNSGEAKNNKKRKKNDGMLLPGLDSVVRPSLDTTSLPSRIVTEVYQVMVPADEMLGRPAAIRTVAKNSRFIHARESKATTEPERIRGGGGGDDVEAAKGNDLGQTVATNPPAVVPGADNTDAPETAPVDSAVTTTTEEESQKEAAITVDDADSAAVPGPSPAPVDRPTPTLAPSIVAPAASSTEPINNPEPPNLLMKLEQPSKASEQMAAAAGTTNDSTGETQHGTIAPSMPPPPAPSVAAIASRPTTVGSTPAHSADIAAANKDTASTSQPSEETAYSAAPLVVSLDKQPPAHWEQHRTYTEDTANTDADAGAKTSPRRPAWWDDQAPSNLERAILVEWFDGSAPHRTTASYLQARATMMRMGAALGTKYLTGTMVRRSIPGDVGSLLRLHALLDSYRLINDNADTSYNESAPTPIGMLSDSGSGTNSGSMTWSDSLRNHLVAAVVAQAQQQHEEFANSEIDWGVVAATVGEGASAADCERTFLNMSFAEQPPSSDKNDDEARGTTEMSAVFQELVDQSDPVVLSAALKAAWQAQLQALPNNMDLDDGVTPVANTNITAAFAHIQRATRAALAVAQATENARREEAARIVPILQEMLDTRFCQLEHRLAVLDDVEGLLEAERVALELERRDLYTARCRHWFGGT